MKRRSWGWEGGPTEHPAVSSLTGEHKTWLSDLSPRLQIPQVKSDVMEVIRPFCFFSINNLTWCSLLLFTCEK